MSVPHPSAWTAGTLPRREETFVRIVPPALRDAIAAELAAQPAGQSVALRDPAVQAFMAACRAEIMGGAGVVILRGLGDLPKADFDRAFLSLGRLLGDPAVQSRRGDLLGHVRKEENDPQARGYRSQDELTFHTDSYEIVGLACVEHAASGGYSRLVSCPAVYAEIARTRPDLLPALHTGFHYAIPEARGTPAEVTARQLPVLHVADGRVHCTYARDFMEDAARRMGTSLPPRLREALDHFDATLLRPDMHLEFLLRQGDMLIWHNFTHLHARTAFENDERHKRLLLRLWLRTDDGHDLPDAFYERGRVYDSVYRHVGQGASA